MRALPVPLHTRLLTLTLAAEGEAECQLVGRLVDVRKRGFATLAGVLNGPGVVHDMELRLTLRRDDLSIRAAVLRMRAVPFPAGPGTRGESCTDNEAGIGKIIGLALDGPVVPALYRAVGGPRGCFHVFTLLRLFAPSARWAVRRGLGRSPGRSFVRTVVVDGFDDEPHLRMRGTLTDVHYAPGTIERPGDVFEAEMNAAITVPALNVGAIEGLHRGGDASWTEESLAGLNGASMARGYSTRVEEVVPPSIAPLRDLLLMVQPTVFQCLPGLGSEVGSMRRGRREGPASAADSCSMWRQDGPLMAAVARETNVGTH